MSEHVLSGKIPPPVLISEQFRITPSKLEHAGVIDQNLLYDTPLFIDPLLLRKSAAREMRTGAEKTFQTHFSNVLKLLAASRQMNDPAWKAAKGLLTFHEVPATCLGYGKSSPHGSGFGTHRTSQILTTGKAVVDLGVRDPDIFPLLAVFEEGIGPDLISDMTTNVIFADLVRYNERIHNALGLRTEKVSFRGGLEATLCVNPLSTKKLPIMLAPKDVLRDLPVVRDWEDVEKAAIQNKELRERLNEKLGELWHARTTVEKRKLKDLLLTKREALEAMLEAMRSADAGAYDTGIDPRGYLFWQQVGVDVAKNFPLAMQKAKEKNRKSLLEVVTQLVEQFKFLIEEKGLWKELYSEGVSRPEKSAQRLFFAVSYAYCRANGVDVTPEAETGNGPVDFKFSDGFADKVLVETKLSSNTKLVHGFETQTPIYASAEEGAPSFFVVVDVGKMGGKDKLLVEAGNNMRAKGKKCPEIVFVDAKPKKSASKR